MSVASGQHVGQSPCGATAARTAAPYDRGCVSPRLPICTRRAMNVAILSTGNRALPVLLPCADTMVAARHSHLLPSCPCHSASARSSAGSQLPVRTGSPFTVVGIGMLCRLAGRTLH
jgi:hypothetical protein